MDLPSIYHEYWPRLGLGGAAAAKAVGGGARDHQANEIQPPPSPDHIPLDSLLYGGVHCEGLVTCSLSPFTHKPNHIVLPI